MLFRSTTNVGETKALVPPPCLPSSLSIISSPIQAIAASPNHRPTTDNSTHYYLLRHARQRLRRGCSCSPCWLCELPGHPDRFVAASMLPCFFFQPLANQSQGAPAWDRRHGTSQTLLRSFRPPHSTRLSTLLPRPLSTRMPSTTHCIMNSLSQTPVTSDRKSTRLNSSHSGESRMPSSA